MTAPPVPQPGHRLVLFDLDGTLTDSAPGIFGCVRHALGVLGWPDPGPERLRAFVGPPIQESFAALGLPEDDIDRAVAAYRSRFGETGLYENEVYDGIPDLLAALRRAGFDLAVATSKPEVYARRILDHFGLTPSFSAVAGATLDGSLRHKDEVIAACLASLGVEATAVAAMVGDRSHDVTGAARHGIPCIGVTWGYGSVEELTRAGVARLVNRPDDLPGALGEILGAATASTGA